MPGRTITRRAVLQSMPIIALASAVTCPSERPVGLQEVSLGLVQAICAHCAALSDVRRMTREISSPAAQALRATSPDALHEAIELEQSLWATLIGFPTRNEAEQHDKVAYMRGAA